MESFSLLCTTCRTRLKVRSEEALGKILGCPRCGGMVQVPSDLATLRQDASSGEASVSAIIVGARTDAPSSSASPAAPSTPPDDSLLANDFDLVNDLLAEGTLAPPVAVPPTAAPRAPSPAPPTASPPKAASPPAGKSGTKLPPAAKASPTGRSGIAKSPPAAVAKAAPAEKPPDAAPVEAPPMSATIDDDRVAAPPLAATAPPAAPPAAEAPPLPSPAQQAAPPIEAKPVSPAEAAPVAEAPVLSPGWVSPTTQRWRTIALYAAAGVAGVVLAILLMLLVMSSFSSPTVATGPDGLPPVDPPAVPPTPTDPVAVTPTPPVMPPPMIPSPPVDPMSVDPPPMVPTSPVDPPPVAPMPPVSIPPLPPVVPVDPAPEDPPADPIIPESPPPKPIERPALPPLDVAARLNDKIVGLEFPPTPLGEFVAFLGDYSTLPIALDPAGLRLAGCTERTPVAVKASDATVRQVLEMALADKQLALQIGDRYITVTHKWLAAPAAVKANYALGDLGCDDPATLAEFRALAATMAAPALAVGGAEADTVQATGGTLIVTQPMETQIDLLRFIERWRMAHGKSPQNAYAKAQPALFRLDPPPPTAIKLATPIQLNFSQPARLAQILARLRAASGVSILVDWAALAEDQLSPQSESTLAVEDVPMSAALSQLAESLGLAWRLVDNETVQLTTHAAALRYDRQPTVEFRRVADLAKDEAAAADLIERIDEALDKPLAATDGSAALHIDLASGYLVARLPRAQQAKLADLLTELRGARDEGREPGE